MRREWIALGIVLLILVGIPVGLFGYQTWRTQAAGVRVIDVVARVPEDGGFAPDRLRLKVGERVRLRLSSPDVMHGLTIPGLGVDVQEIAPGRVVEVEITPSSPGRYAFACTRWCGADHWRMRGVLEVEGDGPQAPVAARVPLYQALGLDIDAMRHELADLPPGRPSVERAAALRISLPATLADASGRKAISPAAAFRILRAEPGMAGLSDSQVWDVVAWAWLRDVPPEALARAGELYARDCAACHGPEGRGDGPAGRNLPGLTAMDPAMPAGPADFTEPGAMLSASDAVLQGKLLRGGMGTGMPEFGSLYTDDELWAMVAYLRTFLFDSGATQTTDMEARTDGE